MYRLPFSIKHCQRARQPWADVNGNGMQNPLIIKKKLEWRTASLSVHVWINSALITFGDTMTLFWQWLNCSTFPKLCVFSGDRLKWWLQLCFNASCAQEIMFTCGITAPKEGLKQMGHKKVWSVRVNPYFTTAAPIVTLWSQFNAGNRKFPHFPARKCAFLARSSLWTF